MFQCSSIASPLGSLPPRASYGNRNLFPIEILKLNKKQFRDTSSVECYHFNDEHELKANWK